MTTHEMSRPAWLPRYIPELDGLRGLAIAAVILYHCADRFHGIAGAGVLHWGWMGVELFFVLSGFLITGILLDTQRQDPWLRGFYIRRTLRIWPVYFLLLLAFAWIAFRRSDPFAASLHGVPWWHYLLFVQNLFLLAMPGPLGPTWSLAIEEQFYLLWAPTARLLRGHWLKWLAIAVVIASPFVRLTVGRFLSPVHTLIHLDGLAIGAVLAIGVRSGWTQARWKGIALAATGAGLAAMAFLLSRGTAFLSSGIALACFGAVALAVTRSGGASLYARVLRLRPLRYLGTISYGLYLVHIAVFAHVGTVDVHLDRWGVGGQLLTVVLRLIGAVGLASILWYGFERPILSLKDRLTAGTSEAKVETPQVATVAD